MQYSKLYATKAQKAIDSGLIDLKAFIEEMKHAGASNKVIEENLLYDLENDGPIFGKFFRSLGYAGNTAITIAEKQASTIVESIDANDELQKLMEEADMSSDEMIEKILDSTPEELEELELTTEDLVYTWICTLQKTCETCLPLHGHALTRAEWNERGFVPGEVHENCACNLVLTEIEKESGTTRQDLIAPITRIKVTDQTTGIKKTIRGVTQMDVDKAITAAEKAGESKEGRRILKILGNAKL